MVVNSVSQTRINIRRRTPAALQNANGAQSLSSPAAHSMCFRLLVRLSLAGRLAHAANKHHCSPIVIHVPLPLQSLAAHIESLGPTPCGIAQQLSWLVPKLLGTISYIVLLLEMLRPRGTEVKQISFLLVLDRD